MAQADCRLHLQLVCYPFANAGEQPKYMENKRLPQGKAANSGAMNCSGAISTGISPGTTPASRSINPGAMMLAMFHGSTPRSFSRAGVMAVRVYPLLMPECSSSCKPDGCTIV